MVQTVAKLAVVADAENTMENLGRDIGRSLQSLPSESSRCADDTESLCCCGVVLEYTIPISIISTMHPGVVFTKTCGKPLTG